MPFEVCTPRLTVAQGGVIQDYINSEVARSTLSRDDSCTSSPRSKPNSGSTRNREAIHSSIKEADCCQARSSQETARTNEDTRYRADFKPEMSEACNCVGASRHRLPKLISSLGPHPAAFIQDLASVTAPVDSLFHGRLRYCFALLLCVLLIQDSDEDLSAASRPFVSFVSNRSPSESVLSHSSVVQAITGLEDTTETTPTKDGEATVGANVRMATESRPASGPVHRDANEDDAADAAGNLEDAVEDGVEEVVEAAVIDDGSASSNAESEAESDSSEASSTKWRHRKAAAGPASSKQTLTSRQYTSCLPAAIDLLRGIPLLDNLYTSSSHTPTSFGVHFDLSQPIRVTLHDCVQRFDQLDGQDRVRPLTYVTCKYHVSCGACLTRTELLPTSVTHLEAKGQMQDALAMLGEDSWAELVAHKDAHFFDCTMHDCGGQRTSTFCAPLDTPAYLIVVQVQLVMNAPKMVHLGSAVYETARTLQHLQSAWRVVYGPAVNKVAATLYRKSARIAHFAQAPVGAFAPFAPPTRRADQPRVKPRAKDSTRFDVKTGSQQTVRRFAE